MYLSGIEVPKLGTVRDRVLRQYLTKESELESKKMQFQALIAMMTMPKGGGDRIKKLWKEYLGLEFGVEIPEHSDKEIAMHEFYSGVVSKLKPKIGMVDGKLKVYGMDALRPNPQTKQ